MAIVLPGRAPALPQPAYNRAPPQAPGPIGFGGADPMRAVRGMQNATMTQHVAAPYAPRPGSPTGPGGQPVLPLAQVAPSMGERIETRLNAPSPFFMTGTTNIVDAQRGPTVPTLPSATKPPGSGAIDTSQGFVNANLAPPSGKLDQAASAFKPVSGIGSAVKTAGANHTLGSTVGGVSAALPAGSSFATAKSPVSTVAPMTSASTPTFGTADNRTAPSGFTAYNAADPNRALKMMRGY